MSLRSLSVIERALPKDDPGPSKAGAVIERAPPRDDFVLFAYFAVLTLK